MHAPPLHPTHVKHYQSLSSGCPAYRHEPVSVYSQVSTFRSLKLEVQIYSPSVKVRQGNGVGGSLVPVFSDNDKIEGKVTLDRSCHHSGILSITVEGSLHYRLSKGDRAPVAGLGRAIQFDGKHVFLSSSTTIAVSPFQTSGRPGSALRDAFMRRRPSSSSIGSQTPAERFFPFSLSLASNPRPGEGLPPTLALSPIIDSPSEDFDISYIVVTSWQPGSAIDTIDTASRLEIPIHFQPQREPQPREISSTQQDSWLELPLRSDHPVPLRCAVTLPTSVTFTQGSFIPYYVVFATKPRSPALAREIMADATISVSLIRKLTMTEEVDLPPSPPRTPHSSDESDFPKNRLLKRVRNGSKTPPPSSWNGPRQSPVEEDKPLPRLPTQVVFSDTKSLKNDVCVGFPKRPCRSGETPHRPYTQESATLPDGLYCSKIPLKTSMLPSVNVQGLIVKYYLDVSVLFGQDDLRARIPIRVL